MSGVRRPRSRHPSPLTPGQTGEIDRRVAGWADERGRLLTQSLLTRLPSLVTSRPLRRRHNKRGGGEPITFCVASRSQWKSRKRENHWLLGHGGNERCALRYVTPVDGACEVTKQICGLIIFGLYDAFAAGMPVTVQSSRCRRRTDWRIWHIIDVTDGSLAASTVCRPPCFDARNGPHDAHEMVPPVPGTAMIAARAYGCCAGQSGCGR